MVVFSIYWRNLHINDCTDKSYRACNSSGFNLQLQSLPANMHFVLTDITLYKDNNVYVDLTSDGVVAKTNPGEGEGVVATSSAPGLEFMNGKSNGICKLL